MGYYFGKAGSKEDLSPAQLERYQELRSSNEPLPPELTARLKAIKQYVGPIHSGEIWAALEELVQDAFVVWVLADEDPLKAQWSDPKDLTVPVSPLTEEEKKAAQEWLDNFLGEVGAREAERPESKRGWRGRVADFFRGWL